MSKYVLKRKDGIVKEYDYIGYYSEGFAAVGRDGKWGYIDEDGIEICPLQYTLPFWQENNPFPFSEGYAVVIKSTPYPTGDGEMFCGYINTKGEEVCSCKFGAACNFDNGIALVMKKNMKWYVINKKFQIITKRGYDEIEPFENGYAAARIETKWGLIDINGNEVCKIKYDNASAIFDEFFPQT